MERKLWIFNLVVAAALAGAILDECSRSPAVRVTALPYQQATIAMRRAVHVLRRSPAGHGKPNLAAFAGRRPPPESIPAADLRAGPGDGFDDVLVAPITQADDPGDDDRLPPIPPDDGSFGGAL